MIFYLFFSAASSAASSSKTLSHYMYCVLFAHYVYYLPMFQMTMKTYNEYIVDYEAYGGFDAKLVAQGEPVYAHRSGKKHDQTRQCF